MMKVVTDDADLLSTPPPLFLAILYYKTAKKKGGCAYKKLGRKRAEFKTIRVASTYLPSSHNL